jgi:hypothetical protein
MLTGKTVIGGRAIGVLPLINTVYLFSNAGFQSLYAGMKALRTPKGKKVAAITFGLGMAMPFIQETLIQLLSADDEEEETYRNLVAAEENANYNHALRQLTALLTKEANIDAKRAYETAIAVLQKSFLLPRL